MSKTELPAPRRASAVTLLDAMAVYGVPVEVLSGASRSRWDAGETLRLLLLDGVLDLRTGLLEVVLNLVTAAFGAQWRRCSVSERERENVPVEEDAEALRVRRRRRRS